MIVDAPEDELPIMTIRQIVCLCIIDARIELEIIMGTSISGLEVIIRPRNGSAFSDGRDDRHGGEMKS